MTWATKLAEPIALTSGSDRFNTLRDAAEFLSLRYSKARGGVLAGAVEDLLKAAEDPTPANVRRATDQFAHFLADEGHIAPRARAHEDDLPRRIADMLAGRSRRVKMQTARPRKLPKTRDDK